VTAATFGDVNPPAELNDQRQAIVTVAATGAQQQQGTGTVAATVTGTLAAAATITLTAPHAALLTLASTATGTGHRTAKAMNNRPTATAISAVVNNFTKATPPLHSVHWFNQCAGLARQ